MTTDDRILIDCLQYCNWSPDIFRDMRAGGVTAVHVTICYHEQFRETVQNMEQWNRWFQDHGDLIVPGRTADDVRAAKAEGKTAIIFGFQNCSP
ncbi:MAG: membrane dipeptidase, partial [Hyphomicrobiales bacterium]